MNVSNRKPLPCGYRMNETQFPSKPLAARWPLFSYAPRVERENATFLALHVASDGRKLTVFISTDVCTSVPEKFYDFFDRVRARQSVLCADDKLRNSLWTGKFRVATYGHLLLLNWCFTENLPFSPSTHTHTHKCVVYAVIVLFKLVLHSNNARYEEGFRGKNTHTHTRRTICDVRKRSSLQLKTRKPCTVGYCLVAQRRERKIFTFNVNVLYHFK